MTFFRQVMTAQASVLAGYLRGLFFNVSPVQQRAGSPVTLSASWMRADVRPSPFCGSSSAGPPTSSRPLARTAAG